MSPSPGEPAPGAADAAGNGDVAAVLAANEAFYRAFEQADLDAMSDVWEHRDDVSCVHPGWPVLRGWGAVSASWMALFDGGERLQFILTNTSVSVEGTMAWVVVDENIISGASHSTVTAINVFCQREGTWRMVAHHGSGVADRTSPAGE